MRGWRYMGIHVWWRKNKRKKKKKKRLDERKEKNKKLPFRNNWRVKK